MLCEGWVLAIFQALKTNRILGICIYFLSLEERALIERRPKIAAWARRQYEKYRSRLEVAKRAGRIPDHQ